jgi:hypothetical protein
MIARRSRPRRGRVIDKAFVAWVRTQPSIVPSHDLGCTGREWAGACWITVHHVRRFGEPKNDRRVVPIWACRHMIGWGSETVEHGKENFERWHGVSLEAEIERLNRTYSESLAA